MNEEFVKAVKDSIVPILSRFTNGITDFNVEAKTRYNREGYYDVKTNDIPMTPCVFKSIRIEGEGNEFARGDEKYIMWRFSWRWTIFDGGVNGTNLIRIITSAEVQRGKLHIFELDM